MLETDQQEAAGLTLPADGNRMQSADSPHRSRWLLITSALVVLLWVSYFAGVSALIDLGNPQHTRTVYLPRAIVSLAGILISLGVVAAQSRLREPSLAHRAAIAAVAAFTAPALQSIINVKLFNFFFPTSAPAFGWISFVTDYGWRLWIWAAASGVILAMAYAADIRDRERRILALQNLAHSVQLRALRFQLNPHFLFNALNSIAGLISAKRIDEAESMTEDLADFLRLTLALDPQKLITLEEELHLQNLYLEVERVRFPDRLTVRTDVPADLRMALVPSLITQPLIENSIKYAVAKSTRPVELAISARQAGDRLELVVADSGAGLEHGDPKGAGLGLRNVGDRIRAHSGERGELAVEDRGPNGFRSKLLLPLELRE